ncbi:MAG TPA: imidazole glycerol phosphate synthase subunit HisF, partial [Chryseosolibacter sp.]|nr:imidazole glycerol phosphate synthase subunit HisF [Chryseosolibacter sp.]
KGVNFANIRDAGDPVALGQIYSQNGADELVFLDISATNEQRKTFASLVREIARHINIPFTVGGGVANIHDVASLLEAGADKIAINSAAVKQPSLIEDLSLAFGSQCVIIAIDARTVDGQWIVHTNGGNVKSNKNLFAWAKEAQERGAGEILFTSMDHDGTKNGFAVEALNKLHDLLSIPVIASGGAGKKEHFVDAFAHGKTDAVLAASVFHFGEIDIPELKLFLHNNQIPIRLNDDRYQQDKF